MRRSVRQIHFPNGLQRDLGMLDGRLKIHTTVCSSFYLESQLNLDLDPAHVPPQRLQIVLANLDEVRARRLEVKLAAAALIEKAGVVAKG